MHEIYRTVVTDLARERQAEAATWRRARLATATGTRTARGHRLGPLLDSIRGRLREAPAPARDSTATC
jgi:hypothetical protein